MTADRAVSEPFAVTRFEPGDAVTWDEFVGRASNGTFLHTRRYLSYHRDRFTDESLLIRTGQGTLVAVLPAAASPSDGNVVISHPGITFAGLVFDDSIRGDRLVEAAAAALTSFADRGYAELDYRPVPAFARRTFGDEDRYALFRLGALRTSCHLSAVVDINRPRGIDAKKRNMLRKAARSGVTLDHDMSWLPVFWQVLTGQLEARYAASPVHSLSEMTDLAERFPDQIQLRVAVVDASTLIAGALTYQYNEDVIHTQYLASDATGRKTAALDLICDSIIGTARERGMRYVSFGPSSYDDGQTLNDTLYRFKHSFGASGVAIEGYRVPCRVS